MRVLIFLLLTPSLVWSWRICLDPGRGGEDPGAVIVCGADSVYEKNVNLQVGVLARDFLSWGSFVYGILIPHPQLQHLIYLSTEIR